MVEVHALARLRMLTGVIFNTILLYTRVVASRIISVVVDVVSFPVTARARMPVAAVDCTTIVIASYPSRVLPFNQSRNQAFAVVLMIAHSRETRLSLAVSVPAAYDYSFESTCPLFSVLRRLLQ